MRKWISGVKLQISEKIEKEEDEKYRKDYADANPSADALTGQLTDEHKDKVQEKVDARFDVEVEEAFEDVSKKAKVMLMMKVPEVLKDRTKT